MTADAETNWEDRLFPLFLSRPRRNPITQIQFDYSNVTISGGVIQVPSPTITALLDTLAAAPSGCGSMPCVLDEDFNIAQGLIRMVGIGKIVRPR